VVSALKQLGSGTYRCIGSFASMPSRRESGGWGGAAEISKRTLCDKADVRTVRRVVDETGTVKHNDVMDAFGLPVTTGYGGDSSANYERYGGAWGYHTAYDMGLLQLGARCYWPEVGRFIQQDPAGEGVNWYAYAENNPVTDIDPEGLLDGKQLAASFAECFMGIPQKWTRKVLGGTAGTAKVGAMYYGAQRYRYFTSTTFWAHSPLLGEVRPYTRALWARAGRIAGRFAFVAKWVGRANIAFSAGLGLYCGYKAYQAAKPASPLGCTSRDPEASETPETCH